MPYDHKHVILKGIGGSQAYGTATPDSDEDRYAIYLAPINDVLGFTDHVQSAHYTEPGDLHIHELQKFLKLVMSGNPTIMELLWLPKYEVKTRLGEELISNRHMLIGREVLESAYVGYAKQQLKRHGHPKPDETPEGRRKRLKHLKHCYRLLLQAESLLATGELRVRLTEREKELIENFASFDPEHMQQAFDWKVMAVNGMHSPIPTHPSRGWAECWLIEVRKRQMLDMEL